MMTDLEWAIDAFDRLFAATCGQGRFLVEKFGKDGAGEISLAVKDIQKLRKLGSGFLSTLSPEERERALAYRGPDGHGELK